MKKYEMTANTKMCFGRKLYQIRALVNFENIKAGDLGGYIEKEENLSQDDIAWVFDNACVYDNAQVHGNAQVFDNVLIYGNARVYGTARVYDDAQIYGNAQVYGNARVSDNVWILDDALIFDDAWAYGIACICGDACVCSDSDYICFKGFGSESRNTTMFRTKNRDVYVCCGCFRGSLKEFLEKVKETHGSSIYAKEYLACVEAAKIHFEIED